MARRRLAAVRSHLAPAASAATVESEPQLELDWAEPALRAAHSSPEGPLRSLLYDGIDVEPPVAEAGVALSADEAAFFKENGYLVRPPPIGRQRCNPSMRSGAACAGQESAARSRRPAGARPGLRVPARAGGD